MTGLDAGAAIATMVTALSVLTAELCIEAGADQGQIPQWVKVGQHRASAAAHKVPFS